MIEKGLLQTLHLQQALFMIWDQYTTTVVPLGHSL